MKINKVTYSAGKTGFFFDDQRAIKAGASHDGFNYVGEPVTDGFQTIRQAGESISIMLELKNGQVGLGDAAAVQYSGAGGRDPLFLAERYIPFLEEKISPLLKKLDLISFKEAAEYIDTLEFEGKPLHTALRYGLSQALLDAVAKSKNKLICEVVCDEFKLPIITQDIPIFGQSGDDRYTSTDKMILKGVNVLPHALINHVDTKLGANGEILEEYVEWLTKRIFALATNDDYNPAIHIDVYGNLGSIFDHDPVKIASYLAKLGKISNRLPLYIEGPVDMNAKTPQIEMLAKIKEEMTRIGTPTKIVADEWCNTYEDIVDFTDTQCCHMVQIKTPDLGSIHNTVNAVLYCKENGMEAYQGGTCNETDVSARCCVHAALASRPSRILAKPGMGFDEGYMITNNEMQRTIALLRSKYGEI